MKGALRAAALVALVLGLVLGFRTWQRTKATGPVAPVEDSCGLGSRPPLLLPELSAAPLQVVAPGVSVTIDGLTPAPELREGTYLVEATASGARSALLQLKVSAFTPVLLEARVTGGAVTLLVLGARCASCADSTSDIDVQHLPSNRGTVADMAMALAGGDWKQAVRAVRGLPPEARRAVEVKRLLAVLYAQAGRETMALGFLEELPRGEALHGAVRAWRVEVARAPLRQVDTVVQRWNALTERYGRVSDAFAEEQPELMTRLTRQFETASTRIGRAHTTRDASQAEVVLSDATKELAAALEVLRATDSGCEYQRRVAATW